VPEGGKRGKLDEKIYDSAKRQKRVVLATHEEKGSAELLHTRKRKGGRGGKVFTGRGEERKPLCTLFFHASGRKRLWSIAAR